MAVSKIIGHINPPKSGWRYKQLQNTINYILNPEKTSGGLLSGAVNCSIHQALKDMIATKEHYGKTSRSISDRLGYHFVISFSPDSVDEETAFEVVKEFTEKYLGQDYEAVYALHNDKEHLHGHICFNSVRFTDGKKYRYNNDIPSRGIKGDWRAFIQPLLDEICLEHGLKTLEMETGVSIDDWTDAGRKRDSGTDTHRKRNSYYKETATLYKKDDFIRHDIDDIVLRVDSMDGFYAELRRRGYLCKIGNSEKYGRYLSVLPPSFPKYRKTYQLGDGYTLQAIQERIVRKNKPSPFLPYGDSEYRFYIPVYLLRFQRVHYMKKTDLHPALKYYYAKLYRLGVSPRYDRSNYSRTKEIMKEIHHLELQMELVYTKQLHDADACRQALDETEARYRMQKEKMQENDRENKPYNEVIRSYKKMKKLNGCALLSADQEEQLRKCEKKVADSGITGEALEKIIQDRQAIQFSMKQLRQEKQELQEIYSRFCGDAKISETEIERDFREYQKIQLEYLSHKNPQKRKMK